jgi:YhcN/YlaJ family sporulation lipoprotein
MRRILFAAALAIALAGCAGRADNAVPPPSGPRGHDAAGEYAGQSAGPSVRTDDPAGFGDESAPEAANEPEPDDNAAERLRRLAESVQGVNSAACIVFGNVAIVGIDVDGSLDRGRVGTVKYAVAEALSKDPAGVRALVTADVDLASRIRAIRESAADGRPIRGLAEQFAELVGRIMPQWPRNTAPRAEPAGHPDDRRNAGDVQKPEMTER